MKKSVGVILGVVAVVMLACIVILVVKYRRQSTSFAESRQAEEAVRTQFNTALESIAEIQDSLTVITPEETHLRDISRSSETGTSVTQTQKDRMLAGIADLKQSIQNSNRKIRDLEKSLKGSQAEVAGLRRIITNLKKSVAEKEVMIARLTGKVDSLNVTVAGLKTDVLAGQQTIAEQRHVIADKRKEIGTIFYIIGSKKDLQGKGIITEKGGVLGMGKSTQLSGALNEGDFSTLDTDQVTEIPIPGKEPQVLSAQIKTSYELTSNEGGAKLRILNAPEFRKVKYLVIMVK